jgi:hypothetical protein
VNFTVSPGCGPSVDVPPVSALVQFDGAENCPVALPFHVSVSAATDNGNVTLAATATKHAQKAIFFIVSKLPFIACVPLSRRTEITFIVLHAGILSNSSLSPQGESGRHTQTPWMDNPSFVGRAPSPCIFRQLPIRQTGKDEGVLATEHG